MFQKLKVVLFETELEDSILYSMLWMLRITNNFFYNFSVARGKRSYQMVMLFNCIGYIGKREMNSWWRVPTSRWMCTTRRGTGRASWELRTRIPPSTGCAEPTKCSTSSWKKSNFQLHWLLSHDHSELYLMMTGSPARRQCVGRLFQDVLPRAL